MTQDNKPRLKLVTVEDVIRLFDTVPTAHLDDHRGSKSLSPIAIFHPLNLVRQVYHE